MRVPLTFNYGSYSVRQEKFYIGNNMYSRCEVVHGHGMAGAGGPYLPNVSCPPSTTSFGNSFPFSACFVLDGSKIRILSWT